MTNFQKICKVVKIQISMVLNCKSGVLYYCTVIMAKKIYHVGRHDRSYLWW